MLNISLFNIFIGRKLSPESNDVKDLPSQKQDETPNDQMIEENNNDYEENADQEKNQEDENQNQNEGQVEVKKENDLQKDHG